MKNFDSSNFETFMVRAGKGRTDMTEKLVVDIKKLRAACTDYVKSHNKPNVTAVLAMSCIPTNIFANARRQYICYSYGIKQTDGRMADLLKISHDGLLTFDTLYDICKSFELTTPVEEFLYKKEKEETETEDEKKSFSREEMVTIPKLVAAMDVEFGERFTASCRASDLYAVVYLAIKNGLEG